MAQPAAPLNNQTFSGFCTECLAAIPSATKRISAVIALGTFIGLFGLASSTDFFAGRILKEYEVWRIFTSFLLSSSFYSLFAILFLFASGTRIEYLKGSVYLLHSTVLIAVLSNIILLFVSALLFIGGVDINAKRAYSLSDSLPYLYSTGPFPAAIGLLALECCLLHASEPIRRFMCFPCNVPTRYYPLALVALFQIFGVQVDVLSGLAAGYAFFYLKPVHLGVERTRRLQNSLFSSWSTAQGFVPVDNVGSVNGAFNPFMIPSRGMAGAGAAAQRQRPVHGSGRTGNIVSSRDYSNSSGAGAGDADGGDSQGSAGTKTSAFTGPGYRLGSTPEAAVTIAAPSNTNATNTSSTSNSASTVATANTRAFADRYERLARSGTTGVSPATTVSSATVTSPANASTNNAPKSAWPRQQDKEAQPSQSTEDSHVRPGGSKRGGYAPLSTGMDDDVYNDNDDNDDDIEMQRVNPAVPPPAAQTPLSPVARHIPVVPAAASQGAVKKNLSNVSAANVTKLMELGYNYSDSVNALSISNDDLQAAIEFLSA